MLRPPVYVCEDKWWYRKNKTLISKYISPSEETTAPPKVTPLRAFTVMSQVIYNSSRGGGEGGGGR